MNERFFDLKKDRQDRIINGSMRIFTEFGYRHASTDEMVAASSISKGLLFHYFKSKKGAFEFLYEYATRYMLLEMREAERRQDCEYYEMQRLLCQTDAAVLAKYPWIPLFLERADRERAQAEADFLPELDGAVSALRERLLSQATLPPFLTRENAEKTTRILAFTRSGLMRELLLSDIPDSESLPEAYIRLYSGYIQMLRKV